MLGYVQCDDEPSWARKLEQLLAAKGTAYSVVKGRGWQHDMVIEDFQHTYRSSHRRGRGRKSIIIFHTLLRFC
jgi:hypothetical protein